MYIMTYEIIRSTAQVGLWLKNFIWGMVVCLLLN